MDIKTLEFKILSKSFYEKYQIPNYATEGSAAIDLRACIEDIIILTPNETTIIGTGIAIHISNRNYAGLILPRSGLGHRHGIVLGNLVGLIDSDYKEELKISAWNRSNRPYQILPGERIAQFILFPIKKFKLTEVHEFEDNTDNHGGFGHSGRL